MLFLLILFFFDEYEMTRPLRTTLAVSQSVDGEISRESVNSVKDVNSLERKLLKPLSARSDVLNLLTYLGCLDLSRVLG